MLDGAGGSELLVGIGVDISIAKFEAARRTMKLSRPPRGGRDLQVAVPAAKTIRSPKAGGVESTLGSRRSGLERPDSRPQARSSGSRLGVRVRRREGNVGVSELLEFQGGTAMVVDFRLKKEPKRRIA